MWGLIINESGRMRGWVVYLSLGDSKVMGGVKKWCFVVGIKDLIIIEDFMLCLVNILKNDSR